MGIIELLNQIPVFKELSEESIATLAKDAKLVDYSPGDKVIAFGQEGKVFGLVIFGEVEASRTLPNGEKEVYKTLDQWEFFGEMSLMTGEPTTADIVVRTSASVILIPHKSMSVVIAHEPSLAARLATTISKRLIAREQSREDQETLRQAHRAQDDPYKLSQFPLPGGGRILTINAGSSSLKYRLFDSEDPHGGMKGLIERIGIEGTRHVYEKGLEHFDNPVEGEGFYAAFDAMVDALGGETGLSKIDLVGHRVVHGGEKYGHSLLIDDEVLEGIAKCEKLAPLHIPANLAGIKESRRRMPTVPQVAVFDTGFHSTIPRHARVYGLPYHFFDTYSVKKYGFHGTSHKFVSLKAATFLKRPYEELELITCHLGNGASVSAVDHGKSIDTSMGMTPLEGLMMGTRSGDIDPGALLHLMKEHSLTPEEMEKILMKESGLLGISGISSDMREVLDAAGKGDDRALLAVQSFCYRVKKYIGSFWASLGGLDALVFTGGIGERSAEIRARVCQNLQGIGVVLDQVANLNPSFHDEGVALISSEDSPVAVLVIHTDEERMIAREAAKAISNDDVTQIIKDSDRTINIGVSAHHVHLGPRDVEALFGEGHKLMFKAPLSQPGQFACQEVVTLVGPKGRVERVRVLGPEREESQVEISRTEEFKLGIDAPIRMSGDLEGTPGVRLVGPKGEVNMSKGVICAKRHIHMMPEDAFAFGVRDRDVVMVQVEGERSLIFGDVSVRVNPNFKLEFHLDTDEANAAELNTGMTASLHSIQSRG